MIAAAGMLPFRMRGTGSTETSLADTYLSAYNCTFTRHCLDLAFSGDYDFLDGVVVVNGCDHVRRLYDTDELYDLRNDPDELKNLVNDPAHADVVREMRDRLLTWFLDTGDAVPFKWDKRSATEDILEI